MYRRLKMPLSSSTGRFGLCALRPRRPCLPQAGMTMGISSAAGTGATKGTSSPLALRTATLPCSCICSNPTSNHRSPQNHSNHMNNHPCTHSLTDSHTFTNNGHTETVTVNTNMLSKPGQQRQNIVAAETSDSQQSQTDTDNSRNVYHSNSEIRRDIYLIENL